MIGIQKPDHFGIVDKLFDISASQGQVQHVFPVRFLNGLEVVLKRFHLLLHLANFFG